MLQLIDTQSGGKYCKGLPRQPDIAFSTIDCRLQQDAYYYVII